MPFSFAVERLRYAHADGTLLFEDVTFRCPPGVAGLAGDNGSGKSTLLRILAGELEPTSGTIVRPESSVLVPQFEHPPVGATCREFLGEFAEFDVQRKAAELGMALPSLQQRADTCSGGEWMQLRILRALLHEPGWLLLDEPTNHLDRRARLALYRILAGTRASLMIATHDRELLAQVNVIYELSNLGIRRYGGNYAAYSAARANEDSAAEQRALDAHKALARQRRLRQEAHERAQHRAAAGKRHAVESNLPKVLRGANKRKAQNTAAKAAKMHERRIEDIAASSARARECLRALPELDLDVPSSHIPPRKVAVMIEAFDPVFPDGTKLFAAPVSLTITGAERVAICGDNGTGKTTILQEIAARARVRSAYLDQRLAILPQTGTLTALLHDAAPHLAEHDRRSRLGRFGFSQERGTARIETLSGGERMRAALLLLFATEAPQLLLLDEPETHLDLHALRELTSALNTFNGALVAVSHDQSFLNALRVERTVRLERNKKEPR